MMIGSTSTIISGDHDLYQCIHNYCSVYHPAQKKLMTKELFKKNYGITPCSWSLVKIIAGCKSDNVPGVKGIGETTAIKYIRGTCSEKQRDKIHKFIESERYSINSELVRLPWPKTKEPKIRQSKFDEKAWQQMCKDLGFPSLKTHRGTKLKKRN